MEFSPEASWDTPRDLTDGHNKFIVTDPTTSEGVMTLVFEEFT